VYNLAAKSATTWEATLARIAVQKWSLIWQLERCRQLGWHRECESGTRHNNINGLSRRGARERRCPLDGRGWLGILREAILGCFLKDWRADFEVPLGVEDAATSALLPNTYNKFSCPSAKRLQEIVL
jgi:hypothetical protein